MLKRWKEYFGKLMNKETDREHRTEEAEVVDEEVNCISREEMKNTLRRIKKGKAIGPDKVASTSLEVHERNKDKVFDQTVQQTISV